MLKEKGWDTNTYSNCWVKTLDGEIIHNKDRKNIPEHDRCETYLMQPTIAEVVMWIYEKHGIWISVEATDDFTMFCFRVRKKEISRLSFNYNTPIEAYEEAIKYTLNNLIYETN